MPLRDLLGLREGVACIADEDRGNDLDIAHGTIMHDRVPIQVDEFVCRLSRRLDVVRGRRGFPLSGAVRGSGGGGHLGS
ncbi:hypothetical protein D3C73_1587090 [compost metagenome]